MIKTRTWVLIFVCLIFISLILIWVFHTPGTSVVQIYQDGICIRQIDLDAVTQSYCFKIPAPNGGFNTVSVEPGRICVSDADCPDQVCMHRGWMSDHAAPIVCIPHHLVIRFVSEGEIDTVVK